MNSANYPNYLFGIEVNKCFDKITHHEVNISMDSKSHFTIHDISEKHIFYKLSRTFILWNTAGISWNFLHSLTSSYLFSFDEQ